MAIAVVTGEGKGEGEEGERGPGGGGGLFGLVLVRDIWWVAPAFFCFWSLGLFFVTFFA